MYTLRPYQSDAVESVYRHLREKDTNPCVVIPTAGGKSLCIALLAVSTPILSLKAVDNALHLLHRIQSFWSDIVTIGLIHKSLYRLAELLVGRHFRHLYNLCRYGHYRHQRQN